MPKAVKYVTINDKKEKKGLPKAQMMCLASFGPVFVVAGLPVKYIVPIYTRKP